MKWDSSVFHGNTFTSSTVIDSIEIIVHRRTRWQRFLHALSLPLRIRLVVRS